MRPRLHFLHGGPRPTSTRDLRTCRSAKTGFALVLLGACGLAGSPARSRSPNDGGLKPSPEMQSIEKVLGGRWSITGKYEAVEATPNGGTLRGEERWLTGPRGFTFREEADDHGPEGEFLEFNLMWWDSTTKSFQGLHCTSGDPHGCDLDGSLHGVSLTWDGKQLVVELSFPKEAKMPFHFFREVFSEITADSFLQTADIGEREVPLKRWITIHATRMMDVPSMPWQ
jgi:hypothetical protein